MLDLSKYTIDELNRKLKKAEKILTDGLFKQERNTNSIKRLMEMYIKELESRSKLK
jgi:hypothetical protein